LTLKEWTINYDVLNDNVEKLVTNYLGGCDFLNYHIILYPRMKKLKRQLKADVKNTRKQQTTNNKTTTKDKNKLQQQKQKGRNNEHVYFFGEKEAIVGC
jgi:hypothetical protein